MALLKYFKREESLELPTASDTGIGEAATGSANAAISQVLNPESLALRKRKHTVYSPRQRAAIGQYAAEHGNYAAVKKFKKDFEHGSVKFLV